MTDAAQLAEAIVDRFIRGEIDQQELEAAITAALNLVKGEGAKSDYVKYYERVKADPVRYARAKAAAREQKRRQKERDPEAYLAQHRERTRARFARDPEALREKSRARYAAMSAEQKAERYRKHLERRRADPEAEREYARKRYERRKATNSEAFVRSERRKQWRRIGPARQEILFKRIGNEVKNLVPRYLSNSAKEDIVSAVQVAYAEGMITLNEIAEGTKNAVKEYNKKFDYFKTQSINTTIPGTENLRLIDTIANDHPKF